MPIPVQNNTLYGGALINQKYSPLAINAVAIDDTIKAEYVALFQNRINLLTGQGKLPKQLNFYAADWPAIRKAEIAGTSHPPIVVISSNRPEWIYDKFDIAKNLEPLDGNFQDVNDLRALVAGSTPWYMPKRVADDTRSVYIMVHRLEYVLYSTLLANTGMTVIGWEFSSGTNIIPRSGNIIRDTYLGFGASRFAAIEFCKYVFNKLVNPALAAARQLAWLVDDNLVYVRGFPGLTQVETAMTSAIANIWGLGFSGATQNSTEDQVMALKAVNAANLGAMQSQGLLQQCVLWNIGQLNGQSLNFSPYFATSNEDSSFSSFLQNQAASKLRVATGATVIKGTPENGELNKDFAFLRDRIVGQYFDIEKAAQVKPAPNNQGGVQNLSNYMTSYVLPKALENIRNQWSIYTECLAVEQIMAKVVADKINWVPAAIFKPNGKEAQTIQLF